MADFVVAIGLVFAIEGILFAAFPAMVRRAMNHVSETPDGALRVVGIISAVIGVVLVWLVRG
ncbi:MAG: DUF2065 domain-containing protein [Alphaproteobacteria bacterium]|nr:DUF2065 domain-containing protein [Alphaproteobacteria bacterium]